MGKWLNKKIKEYLENKSETILDAIPDEMISNFFDKTKDSIIKTRHLKKDLAALKIENEKLKKKVEQLKKG